MISGLVSCAALPYRREILQLLGASGEALDVASTYLVFTLPATIGLGLGMALAGILRGVADARRAMYVTLSGALATAVLDPIFIFGLGLGVKGAAIVTPHFRRRRAYWRGRQT
jgi:Na+-driven multidrug efflux pump